MSEFQTILVTTDLSDNGNAAVARGFRLARQEGARVVLLHVLEDAIPNPLYAHYYPTPSPARLREQQEELRRLLAALVPPDARAVPHEIRLGHGPPAAAVCRAAEELGASLVVVSSRGRTAQKRFAIGSVAERIARHAPCSVLLLRPSQVPESKPARRPSRRRRPA